MSVTSTINNNELDLKFKALSSEFRRSLLGLIYSDGPLYQSDILKEIEIESNKLAYHLNKLHEANLIDQKYERAGKQLSKYRITKEGEKFLEAIGAKNRLKELARQYQK